MTKKLKEKKSLNFVAGEDNIERKKTELNVDLNESLNTINKGNVNKVSSVGIIVFLYN
jgi:hypothetical protein